MANTKGRSTVAINNQGTLQSPDIYLYSEKAGKKVGKKKSNRPKPPTQYKATPQDIERKISFRKQV